MRYQPPGGASARRQVECASTSPARGSTLPREPDKPAPAYAGAKAWGGDQGSGRVAAALHTPFQTASNAHNITPCVNTPTFNLF
jgi:hypothetical protein